MVQKQMKNYYLFLYFLYIKEFYRTEIKKSLERQAINMSLNSIKRDLKDYIEENKALLEAWERVTYLTKKDGTPFKSMSKNFNNAIYKRKESFRGYILEVDTKFTPNHRRSYFRNYIDCCNKDNPNTLEEIKQKVSKEIESKKRFIKSLEKRLEIIDYAYEEFSKSYDDIRENLKELCENDVSLANMICEDIAKR